MGIVGLISFLKTVVRNGQPALVIDESGIVANNYGLIPWSIIERVLVSFNNSSSFHHELHLWLSDFEKIRSPVMTVPRWVDTRCQPIAVDDVIGYLVGCLQAPATAGLTLDIGGPEITTYRAMMRTYARVRGLRRLIIPVPVLTPRLSAHWINLVTPVPAGVVYPLVEGLKNEVICRDQRIRELIPIPLTPMDAAVCNALAETAAGPGKLTSRQSCFLDR